jgi:ABC-type transport system substrate-binding protein
VSEKVWEVKLRPGVTFHNGEPFDATAVKFSFERIYRADFKSPQKGWRRLWTAELPTTNTGDSYYRIVSYRPLVAYSICSYECEIDLDTGRILRRSFFK